MAFVIKFAKTVRNNWKKSIFFTGLAVWGADYGKKKWEESLLRTAYCLEAKKYGDEPCPAGVRPRKVTVFLNPAAQGGKSKKLFEKNVAPVLHLAGLQVTVVKTEYEGQAKQYMGVLEDADAIVVAGGNGTLVEVLTGLLRRSDQKLSKIPVGVVPLGKCNTMAQNLFLQGESNVRWLLEAAMAVVKNQTKPADVMCIKGTEDRTVFALNSLDWGMFRDAEERKTKYWYYGALKDRFTYLWTCVRYFPHIVSADITYQLPCEGCSKCYVPPPKPKWKWWHMLFPPRIEVPKKDYANMTNEECGQEHSTSFTTVDFSCKTCNNKDSLPDDRGMELHIGPDYMTRSQFISEGWRRVSEQTEEGKDAKQLTAGKFSLQPTGNDDSSFFSIDKEQYEAMPVEVELLKDKIQVFCGNTQTPFVS